MASDVAATFDEHDLARRLRDAKTQSMGVNPAGVVRERDADRPQTDTIEDEQAQAAASELTGLLLKQKIGQAVQQLEQAAATVSQTFAQKISAQASYSIWKFAWINIPDTLGFSLFALVLTNLHYIIKKLGIPPLAKLLCEPGEDGMMGMLPPAKINISVVKLVYKWTNIIALIAVDCLLLLVSVLAFAIFMLPIILWVGIIYSISQFDLGQLAEIIKTIFYLL